MNYHWDPGKAATNLTKHGVDFAVAEAFEWNTAIGWVDKRQEHGEIREIAVGFIETRLYVMVFTLRDNQIRIISLRKANKREVAAYEQAFD